MLKLLASLKSQSFSFDELNRVLVKSVLQKSAPVKSQDSKPTSRDLQFLTINPGSFNELKAEKLISHESNPIGADNVMPVQLSNVQFTPIILQSSNLVSINLACVNLTEAKLVCLKTHSTNLQLVNSDSLKSQSTNSHLSKMLEQTRPRLNSKSEKVRPSYKESCFNSILQFYRRMLWRVQTSQHANPLNQAVMVAARTV
jgi:hypothetical protein